MMTQKVALTKVKDSSAERKGIEKHLVPGFLMTRKERASPNTTPDILRGGSKA